MKIESSAISKVERDWENGSLSVSSGLYSYPSYFYNLYRQNLSLFPLMFCLTMPVSFFVFYCIAAYYGHLQFFLMYISDAGTFKPTAGFFAQGIDIIAICFFLTFLARYKQYQFYLKVKVPLLTNNNVCEWQSTLLARLQFVNFLSFLVANLLVFATMGVGNFRCSENFLLHVFSAFSMFTLMFAYAALTIYLCNHLWTKWGIETRPVSMTLWLACGLTLLVGAVICNVAASQYGTFGGFFSEHTSLFWSADEPGFGWHVFSAASEWTLIYSTSILFFCIHRRMSSFTDWLKIDF